MRRHLAAAVLLVALPGLAAADGAAVFAARCALCHALAPGGPAKPGPLLQGLIGRPVGGDPAFDYSPTLKTARAQGQVWDAALLERFLAHPEEMFPGLWMGDTGLRAHAFPQRFFDFMV